jgi:membrane protein YqaA with SNARE-associated domain
LHTLKTLLAKWTAFLWALLKPLGVWGVFAIGAVDAAFLAMPLDPVVAGYVYNQPHRFWLYTLMAAAGSASGNLVVYIIGYGMGELVLEKRIGKERFQRMRDRFDRHEFLTLMLPAILPPPFPFKPFALSAAVFEMHITRFLLAIFAGRVVRFLILSLLVIKFGPQAVTLAGRLVGKHLVWVLAAVGVVIAAGVLFWLRERRKQTRIQADQRG